jgi:hypothetical protein
MEPSSICRRDGVTGDGDVHRGIVVAVARRKRRARIQPDRESLGQLTLAAIRVAKADVKTRRGRTAAATVTAADRPLRTNPRRARRGVAIAVTAVVVEVVKAAAGVETRLRRVVTVSKASRPVTAWKPRVRKAKTRAVVIVDARGDAAVIGGSETRAGRQRAQHLRLSWPRLLLDRNPPQRRSSRRLRRWLLSPWQSRKFANVPRRSSARCYA